MTFIDAAERLLPARHFSRLQPVLHRLGAIMSGADEHAAAQRMALIAFAIRVVSAAIAFVSQIILARMMGDFEYGIFVFVWVIAVILGNLSCLGFHATVIRFLPQYRVAGSQAEMRGLTATARIFAMISATVIAAAGIGTIFVLGDRIEAYYVAPLIIGAFALPMIALGDVLDGTARANNWPVYALSPTYIARPLLILMLLMATMALFGQVNAKTALVGALVATYVTSLSQYAVILRKLGSLFSNGSLTLHLRTWIAVAFPIFLIEGFYFLLTNADVIIVGIYLPPERVAVYFAAAKTMALVHFVYFAVKAAAAPRFSSLVSVDDTDGLGRFASQTARWSFWPSLVVGAVAIAASPFLLSLFGPGYLDGRYVMMILLVGILAKAMIGPAEVLLTMTGHQKICALIYGFALATNIALNIWLIPEFGIEGAATATMSAMVVEAIILHLTVRAKLGFVQFVGTDHRGRPALFPAQGV